MLSPCNIANTTSFTSPRTPLPFVGAPPLRGQMDLKHHGSQRFCMKGHTPWNPTGKARGLLRRRTKVLRRTRK